MYIVIVILIMLILSGYVLYIIKFRKKKKKAKNITITDTKLIGKKWINENLFLYLVGSLIKLEAKYFIEFEIIGIEIENIFKILVNEEMMTYLVIYEFRRKGKQFKEGVPYIEYITFFDNNTRLITRLNNYSKLRRNDFGYISSAYYKHLEKVEEKKKSYIFSNLLKKNEFKNEYLKIFKSG